MKINYLKSPRLLVGLSIILLMLFASLLFSLFSDELLVPEPRLLYNENGELIAASPFPPSIVPPFGTDRLSYNIFYKVIDGAKYTLLMVFFVAMLRVLISFLAGLFCHFYLFKAKKGKSYFISFFQAFYSIPQVLLAFILITPFSIIGFHDLSFYQLVFYQIIVLIIISVPHLTLLIADECKRIANEQFMDGAKVLGGSTYHLFKKHMLPHLSRPLLIFFSQQVGQVLLLLIHLGLLELFLGGAIKRDLGTAMGAKFITLTNEWSGLIGMDYKEIVLAPWIIVAPLVAFMITILCVNIITEELERPKKRSKVEESYVNSLENTSADETKNPFTFLK
ncbi:ABC transporter permease [Bacillus sp. DJP31]|uniref:ABC transporter permease n=1 Tax=Bacillus sp. DJP31 TaxID=3409789 RepID=UPI003BB74F38